MKRTFKSADNSRGFTLIEIIAVLVIIAVVSAIVISRGFSTSIYNLKSEADRLRTHLRYAQARAMSSSTIWGINIFSATSYSLFYFDNVSNTAITKILPGEDGNTVDLTASGVTAGPPMIVSFDSFGRPYTDAAGTALQSGDSSITLTSDGQPETITITQNTGFIP